MDQSSPESALLVMDMQSAILRNYPAATELTQKVVRALAGARDRNIAVLFVVLSFREGLPEISPLNKRFAAIGDRMGTMKMGEWAQIDPALSPLPGEILITKRRVSAFTGSDLELVLRARGIRHLVLTGIATSGVVLSTLLEAADKDYRLTVLEDACGDTDPEVHRVLTTRVFPRAAEVLTVSRWNPSK